jgi:hypothetical protein
MIDKELLMISSMVSGGLLGSLGGYKWKWLRRFVLPFILGIISIFAGFIWWKCLILIIGLMVSFCLPYGSKTPLWLKCIVACTFTLPTLILGYSIWQIITPIVFIGMFLLSNWKFSANEFVWKIVEFITFALVGVTVAQLIH